MRRLPLLNAKTNYKAIINMAIHIGIRIKRETLRYKLTYKWTLECITAE